MPASFIDWETTNRAPLLHDSQIGTSVLSFAAAATAAAAADVRLCHLLFVQGEQGTPIIMARHVEDALTKARPSVPLAEKRRLEAIYAKFSNNRDPNIGGGADHKGKGKQVATLA